MILWEELINPDVLSMWNLLNGLIEHLKPLEYVGITDVEGKEMHEGDIDANGMIVTYCGDQASGLGMNVGWYLQTGDFEKWVELESKDNHLIIGNIYQNPELSE